MLRRKPSEPVTEAEPQPATEPVTGLPDRSNLEPWLIQLAAEAESKSSRVALAFVEMGQMSDVNDIYGPDISDQILGAVAQRLASMLEPGQLACHYHGAELAVLAPGVSTIDAGQHMAQAMLEALSEPVAVGSAKVVPTTAAGVALSDSGYSSVADWLQDAHMALAEAKAQGHRSSVVHDESTRNRVDVRVTPGRVLKGWTQSEFSPMYQPIVAATEPHTIVGFEALLRWRDPGASGTFIGPEQFVYLLERTGLIVPVGAWMIKEACGQIKDWQDVFGDREPMFVTVNLGAHQLAEKSFADSVVSALDQARLKPERLVLEITEDALRFNKGATWSALRDLKYLGIKLCLDDFGVGESGVSYLRQLPVDYVTIHRDFMQGVGETREDTAVVKALIELGRDLGIATIVEGVENQKQDELVRAMAPDFIQGFYYGRPEMADTTSEMLKEGPTLVGSEDWMGGLGLSGEVQPGAPSGDGEGAPPPLRQIAGPED